MGVPVQNAPPISPYIGLVRSGASPGVNWANIVQPQMQLYDATNQLQGQQTAMAAGGGTQNVPTTTGHPVYFGSYMQYYNSRGLLSSMGGMGMGGMGMGGMGMGGMGMGGMGMGGVGMGGMMGMGGMGMGGMGMPGMGGMGGMGMGGMGMPGMGGAGYTPGR
jgi:hypothetical protein